MPQSWNEIVIAMKIATAIFLPLLLFFFIGYYTGRYHGDRNLQKFRETLEKNQSE